MTAKPELVAANPAVLWDDIFYIASNMRESDREEVFAARWNEDARLLADDCAAVASLPTSMTLTTCYNNVPAVVCGAVETWPSVWDVWCFGTDDFERVALGVTKWCHRTMIPGMLARGMRRAHCRSMFTHYKAHDWLRSFNVDSEILLKSWGKNGEDFILFEWYRESLLGYYQPREPR